MKVCSNETTKPESLNTIIVSNINNNETIHHSLLLLRGTVHHENCDNTDSELKISVQNDITATNFKATYLNSNFKCILELKPGDNNIILTYCCTSANLTIKYVRRKSKFQVVPIYIINDGHDGRFQAPDIEVNTAESACDRILTGCKLLQCFIAEKLNEEGMGRKTFQIASEKCITFHSKLHFETARKMKQDELWSHVGREIMSSDIGCSENKYLGFLSCTKYRGNEYTDEINSHDDIVTLTDGYVALGGGGLALFGSACLYTWPENVFQVVPRFEDETVVDKTRFMDDSCYRGTTSACFSTTLGSVLHELCHTFDLGHTSKGIMARGFDNMYKFFITCPSNITTPVKETSQVNPKCSAITIKVGEKINNSVIKNPTNFYKVAVDKFDTEDENYFTKSCLGLLCYHKYFNDHPIIDRNFTLTFDGASKFLKSTAGIRIVEIRDVIREMVLEHWTFVGKVLKYSFKIPEESINEDSFVLVVEDNVGTILKEVCTK